MTKQELEKKVQELEWQIATLETTIDNADDAYSELEDKLHQMEIEMYKLQCNGIRNVENFISRLELDNMLTPELEREIIEYLRYHNE